MAVNGETYLTFVIPAYNEAERIGSGIGQVIEYAEQRNLRSELIVVDDGSSDDTAQIAQQAAAGRIPVQVLRNLTNQGKGYSVKRGMLAAGGRYVGFVDADMSTPIGEVDKVLSALEAGAQVAIGSRTIAGAVIDQHQPWWREQAGKLFGLFTRLVLLPGIADSQCGFKFFTREAAQEIFSRQELSGWAFDAEVLYIARQLGYTIAQIPVRWADDPRTKVNMVGDGLRMALDVLRIRALHRGSKSPDSADGRH